MQRDLRQNTYVLTFPKSTYKTWTSLGDTTFSISPLYLYNDKCNMYIHNIQCIKTAKSTYTCTCTCICTYTCTYTCTCICTFVHWFRVSVYSN